MAMKGYFTFPRAPEREPNHLMKFSVISRTYVERGSYPSAEMQSPCSTAPTECATEGLV